jgi:hypothetical protein
MTRTPSKRVKPITVEEMQRELRKRKVTAAEVCASLALGDDEGGWYAVVQRKDNAEFVFETLEYAGEKTRILADLETVGIEVL